MHLIRESERERYPKREKRNGLVLAFFPPPLKKKQNGCNRNRYTTVVVKNLLLPTQR